MLNSVYRQSVSNLRGLATLVNNVFYDHSNTGVYRGILRLKIGPNTFHGVKRGCAPLFAVTKG